MLYNGSYYGIYSQLAYPYILIGCLWDYFMIYNQLVIGVIYSYVISFMTVSWAITEGFMTSPTRRIGRIYYNHI